MIYPRFRHVLNQKKFLSLVTDTRGLLCARRNISPLIFVSESKMVSTYEVKSNQKEESTAQKFLKKIPFLNVNKIKVAASGYLLYENVADKIDYYQFFEKYKLPDTFYSWFVVTEMHVWMLSARAMAEGEDGQTLRNSIIEAMWSDVARRTKKLGAANPAAMRSQIQELSDELQAAFLAYDEGLQSDDIVLAGALWRRLYQKQYASPEQLEGFVRYIRKHISVLDNLSKEQILDVEPVKWESI